jgi:A/G-specific adenine glycosylase
LQSACSASLQGRQADFPQPKPRKALPRKRTLMPLLLNRDGAILLYRRPPSGLWGGLWSLPELEHRDQFEALARQHGLQLQEPRALEHLSHSFSHFQLAIEPWLIRVEQHPGAVAEADWLWYNLASPPRLGLAAPVKKLLRRSADELHIGEAP